MEEKDNSYIIGSRTIDALVEYVVPGGSLYKTIREEKEHSIGTYLIASGFDGVKAAGWITLFYCLLR